MKKLTRPQLVAAINSYPGPKLHDRVKREIMMEILAYRQQKHNDYYSGPNPKPKPWWKQLLGI